MNYAEKTDVRAQGLVLGKCVSLGYEKEKLMRSTNKSNRFQW